MESIYAILYPQRLKIATNFGYFLSVTLCMFQDQLNTVNVISMSYCFLSNRIVCGTVNVCRCFGLSVQFICPLFVRSLGLLEQFGHNICLGPNWRQRSFDLVSASRLDI